MVETSKQIPLRRSAADAKGAARRKMAGTRAVAVLVVALALLTAIACYNNNTGETRISDDIYFVLPAFPETGSNKVQVFTEMHYQPSYRSQEGPRLQSPDGAVPITGAEVVLASAEEYAALENPGGDVNSGAQLYAVNCVVCHGDDLAGTGKVMVTGPNMVPANLLAEITTERPDGELYGLISFGGSIGYSTRLAALSNPDLGMDMDCLLYTSPSPRD